ncbi:ABC transporter substrate-binding protein [Aquimarina brevivitae]|uniref:Iron complex transport system substrate-binding protein n=1 Tax=Aquimarina brevivitae TaxID=323412 RepID=A0A4Q7P1P9_9FLAO|nr:ABC transporter substrate-binding protein [Aquimarina brevivitae]RZS93497.1 iron complex transport system substrate-binding protein [Aquimarina brevivitae]
MRYLTFFFLLFSFNSCIKKQETTSTDYTLQEQEVTYASGFSIKTFDTYKKIEVSSPWPESKKSLTYILYPKGTQRPTIAEKAIFIPVPIEKTIITSSTDIPILEYLEVEGSLVGFPNTNYITSEKTRRLIEKGQVKELGSERDLNTEIVLELDPDVVIGFSTTGDTKAYDLIGKTGIPVVMNGSWTEQHPLGRAEWIKFIAAFYGKEQKADSIFTTIAQEYQKVKQNAISVTKKPTVLSGDMFKDVWYAPGGHSFLAQMYKDAQTNYLWKNTDKTGSIALSFESALDTAQNADIWFSSGSANSLAQLASKNHNYSLFDAYKNKKVYSPTLKKGLNGGVLYYELGPMRPDLILKDIVKIAHPELLKNYDLYFFEKLN